MGTSRGSSRCRREARKAHRPGWYDVVCRRSLRGLYPNRHGSYSHTHFNIHCHTDTDAHANCHIDRNTYADGYATHTPTPTSTATATATPHRLLRRPQAHHPRRHNHHRRRRLGTDHLDGSRVGHHAPWRFDHARWRRPDRVIDALFLPRCVADSFEQRRLPIQLRWFRTHPFQPVQTTTITKVIPATPSAVSIHKLMATATGWG